MSNFWSGKLGKQLSYGHEVWERWTVTHFLFCNWKETYVIAINKQHSPKQDMHCLHDCESLIVELSLGPLRPLETSTQLAVFTSVFFNSIKNIKAYRDTHTQIWELLLACPNPDPSSFLFVANIWILKLLRKHDDNPNLSLQKVQQKPIGELRGTTVCPWFSSVYEDDRLLKCWQLAYRWATW